jgi:hypothetical protein
MTTEEALKEIGKAHKDGREMECADTNPHWWMGVRSDGTFWYYYQCCDPECDQNEYQQFATLEELEDEATLSGIKSEWEIVGPRVEGETK